MKIWEKSLLLSVALLLVALSSVSAWPSLPSAKEETSALLPAEPEATPVEEAEKGATQELTSAVQEPEAVTTADMSAPSIDPASTEPQKPSDGKPELGAEITAMMADDPDALEALLRGSLGDRAYERIEPYIDIMISEYNDACNRHDALAAEYTALAADNTKLVNDAIGRDVDVILVPEAVYDITEKDWGVGATLGISWKNLMLTAGVEKMINDDFLSTDGFRVRAGLGISL